LLKNPVNWLIIWLALFIGAFALHSVAPQVNL
jgi:hypothetical protein